MNSLLTSAAELISGAGLAVDESGAAWVLGWLALVLGMTLAGVALRAKVNVAVWFGGLAIIAPPLLFLALGFEKDPHAIESPLIGKLAPDFVLSPVAGGAPVRLSDTRSLPAVVNFWATWCVPCKAEHRTLVAVARRMEGKANFFGVVYQDEPEKILAWLGKMGGGYPQLVDVGSKAAIAYGVYGVPETYVIDTSGVVRWKFTGPVDAASLLEQLAALVQP